MNGILERRFQRFEEITNINLKEYFGIIDTPQYTILQH